jgi:predicted alpha/beta superfamily hydrolase
MTDRPSKLLLLIALAAALLVAAPAPARDAMVTFKVNVPEGTPTDAKVYIAGDIDALGPWDPGKVALGKIGDQLYAITLVLPVGSTFNYKFTRGTWETVEKGEGFEEIPDRSHEVTGDETVPVTVENWRDFSLGRERHTVVGVFELHLDFPATKLGNNRTIVVWLPPGYDDGDSETRYPVLYMHDGQNIFDAYSSYIGVEWNVDESLTRMIESGQVRPLIVVGIYNTSERVFEYTDVPDRDRGGGGASLYADFLVNELKPFIDSQYRTLPDRANTGVMGSSLGANVSIYLAWNRPDVFSKVGAMSTAYGWAGGHLILYLEEEELPSGTKLWLDLGTAEGSGDRDGDGVPDLLAMHRQARDVLMEKGMELKRDLRYVEDVGAVHNERAWASRLPRALEFLFPAR